jgi:hypothetical protein
MAVERIQTFADHYRFCSRNDRHEPGEDDNDSNPAMPGSEIPNDAASQLAVRILAIVFFFVETFVKTHG